MITRVAAIVAGSVGISAALLPTQIGWSFQQQLDELTGSTFTVPGSDTSVRLWSDTNGERPMLTDYQIQLGAEGPVATGSTAANITLRYAQFDPMVHGAPTVPAALEADDDLELFIVQFHTPAVDAYRDDLASRGATLHKYLPHRAYVMQMTDDVRTQIEHLPYVRWVGDFHPAYRVDEVITNRYEHLFYGADAIDVRARAMAMANGQDAVLGADHPKFPEDAAWDEEQIYSIQVFQRGELQKQFVANRIEAMGGVIEHLIPDGFLLRATLTPRQLLAVLNMNEVAFVDPWGPPETDMNIAREIGGADYIESELGFTGQGVRGEVMDTNIRQSHVDFQNPPATLHGNHGGDSSHGTATYGIVFATGTGSANGRGMLPDAEAKISADFDFLGNRYTHTSQLTDPGGAYRAVFQSNSWGNSRTTTYTTISAEMDDILLLNDITICQSQSNSGGTPSRPQAWAKNIVSVGGVYHRNTLTKTDDGWSFGASTGPADDGRTKPDLTHFYDSIFCPSSSGDNAYTSSFGGTSGATPIVAGYVGLMYQMWHEGVFDGFGGDATVFDSRPNMATAKALMINSAMLYDQGDLTRYRQGWGMPDLTRLYDMRDNMFIIDESDPLQALGSVSYAIFVAPDEPDLKVTMVYTDTAGNVSSTIDRINDLNLQVTSPSGTIYHGNNGLATSNWSASGGSPNDVDTVENVFVETPESGEWTVTITAAEVNEDSNLDTGTLDADFALVVSGGAGEPAMNLSVDPLFGGQFATASTDNSTPGETVYLIYSLTGTGSTYVPALDVTLNLNNPQLGSSAVADGSGTASFNEFVPDVPPTVVWLQAAEAGRKSNVVLTQIN